MRARALAAVAAVVALLPALSLGAEQRVTIAFTNDFESAYDPVEAWWRDDMTRIGGIAELATLVGSLRETSETFFLFDAGDIFTGTLAQRTQGAVSFDVMGRMDYDAMVIGNHEFEYGWEVLAEQKNRVAFPVLGANLFYRGTEHPFAQPWVIIERDGVRVGVIGVMGQDAGTALIPAHIAGLEVQRGAAGLEAAGVLQLFKFERDVRQGRVKTQIRGSDGDDRGLAHMRRDNRIGVFDILAGDGVWHRAPRLIGDVWHPAFGVSSYIENEVPQPQLDVALGFSITKRAPINSSEKSITALHRKGSETLSTPGATVRSPVRGVMLSP